jgi:hypothetical protein
MKLKIFSLRDQKTDAYLNPMAMQTPGQIIRMIQDEIQKPDNLLAQHPEDFELFQIGEFDTETGQLTGTPPKSIALINDLKPNN